MSIKCNDFDDKCIVVVLAMNDMNNDTLLFFDISKDFCHNY